MVYLTLRGNGRIEQCGRTARLEAGDLAIYDQAQPFSLEFVDHTREIVLSIPRPLLASRLPSAHRLTARRISGASKLGALAGTIVRQLAGLEEQLDDTVADRLCASALDILATTVEVELTGAKDSGRRLDQVKRYVLANLHDAEMTVETIAKTQNMARRTLTRLFAAEGTTPMRWIWQQRLAASYRALAEGQIGRITDAALSFGYSDLSHFSRSFRKAYGHSPRVLLA